MANEHLTAGQIVARAAGRAVPARKFIKLVQGWSAGKAFEPQQAEDELTYALLDCILRTSTAPAILLGYLTLSLSSGLVSVTTLTTHLLYRISDGQNISSSILVTISTLLLSNIPLDYALPSTLNRPTALNQATDPGPSTPPASTSATPTLALLLPLIRQCCIPSTPPATVTALLGRLLSSLQPYPAPPLDVNLEAGSLTSSLPEVVAAPLRDCLTWFMNDFAVSQGAAQLNISDEPAQTAINVPAIPTATEGPQSLEVPTLPPFADSVPLRTSLDWELSWILRSNRWTRSDPAMAKPPENHIALLRLAPLLSSDAGVFLRGLLSAAIRYHEGIPGDEAVLRWLFVTERLPILLKFWKGTSDLDFAYPDDLREALLSVFQSEKEGLDKYNAWISATSASLMQAAEAEDDTGGFSQPEGWMLCSLQVTLVQRLVELGLLQRSDASALLPGIALPSTNQGESLIARIGAAPRSHLKALAHIIAFAPGGASSVAKEAYEAVRSSPAAQPLEGLFVNLAQAPTLLAALGGCISAATWMDVIRSQLIEHPDDPAARTENPQDSKSRYGEGIVLAEAFISQYELPFPPLLRDARRAVSLSSLDASKKSCIDGWIKALFGPDGIDDEIILATTPAEFYRLAPGVIQQAVLATAAGQIDMDTLHNGLSYFSQPLLSWSLGGIVQWLADDIIRNGPISALHLNVLQTLLLTSPPVCESVLRVSGKRLADIIQPTSGLQDVLKSSSFDVAGVKQKLDAAGVVSSSGVSNAMTLRQSLVSLQQIETAPSAWATQFAASLESAIRTDGLVSTLRNLTNDILNLAQTSTTTETTIPYLIALVIAQQSAVDNTPLLPALIETVLPGLFDSTTSPLRAPTSSASTSTFLARLLKQALLASAYLDPTAADKYADALVDELAYQRSRPIKRVQTKVNGAKARKRAKTDEISADARAALDAVTAALAGDQELKRRWIRFGDLAPGA